MIEEAVKFAEESPWPSPEEVLRTYTRERGGDEDEEVNDSSCNK